MKPVSSWGRLSADPHEVIMLDDPKHILAHIQDPPRPGLPYGMGRSYGDVCLNPEGILWRTTGMDHLIAFDARAGRLTCEAGVLLRDIQRLVIPRGWILPVTPGTQLVTVGGAIANDVHGKSHHVQGSFGEHVARITLARTDGEIFSCGPERENRPEWFAATVGGMGLTGVITTAELRLRPVPGPWLDTETLPFADLETFFALSGESSAWEHTVAWIDCISGQGERGIFIRGNHVDAEGYSEPRPFRLSVPFVPPVSLVNRLTLRLFNMAYYHLKKWRAGRAILHYEPFFYPLDGILEWNRMYGPRGFFQYQSVVPHAAGLDAVRAMLGEIARSGAGSFLAVLKTFGERPAPGMLSFPEPGVTLALDFPNHGPATHELFARLDAIVREARGRLYPAKDARMPRALFLEGYPRLAEFLPYRDPGISSGLSRRLMETGKP
jgi:FAD/FMN-containing dehydrogenase